MKITEVSVIDVREVDSTPNQWRAGLPLRPSRRSVGMLRISTDEGIDGFAEIGDPHYLNGALDRLLRGELIGADPMQREFLWQRVWELNRVEYYPITLLGLVDIALWDIAGKAAGVPVYKLLGGYRTELPAYASTVTFSSTEEYLDVVDQCLELGYHGIKLHAWGDARRDAELSHAVRNRVGADFPLMFDASGGLDLPDAIHLGRALAEANYLWFEEPMREANITSHDWLARAVGVPLLVAEVSPGSHQTTADFVASGCAPYVRTSAGFKAGITGAMRVAHLADAFQLRAEVHGPGLANEHLCMAISNTTFYESLVTSVNVRQDDRLTTTQMLPAPREPGIGYPVPKGVR